MWSRNRPQSGCDWLTFSANGAAPAVLPHTDLDWNELKLQREDTAMLIPWLGIFFISSDMALIKVQ